MEVARYQTGVERGRQLSTAPQKQLLPTSWLGLHYRGEAFVRRLRLLLPQYQPLLSLPQLALATTASFHNDRLLLARRRRLRCLR